MYTTYNPTLSHAQYYMYFFNLLIPNKLYINNDSIKCLRVISDMTDWYRRMY
jgi:hypothetical protein